jgi:uncharacterized protein
MHPAVQNLLFTIDVPKLRPGANSFHFHMDSAFFAQQPNSLIQTADVQVAATVDCQPALLDTRLHLQGHIELVCDRCLQPYPQTVSLDHRIVYSYSQPDAHTAEGDDELIFIARNQQTLDLTQDLYELVSLQVPLRKARCDEDASLCLADPTVRQLLEGSQTEDQTDPRWEALNKLKDN